MSANPHSCIGLQLSRDRGEGWIAYILPGLIRIWSGLRIAIYQHATAKVYANLGVGLGNGLLRGYSWVTQGLLRGYSGVTQGLLRGKCRPGPVTFLLLFLFTLDRLMLFG